MNYHDLIGAVQQYLTSGFPFSRDYGRVFLRSLDGAIGDGTTAPGQLKELVALKAQLAALTTRPEPFWPGSTTVRG